MSAPTKENGLALATVYFGGKHMQDWGQIRVSVVPTGPTAGPETSPETEERASWGGGGGLWLTTKQTKAGDQMASQANSIKHLQKS